MVIAGILAEVAEDERSGWPGSETEGRDVLLKGFFFNTKFLRTEFLYPRFLFATC